jgi:hypothetical protein
MKRYLAVILLVLPILGLANPISLVSETADMLILRFEMPEYQIEKYQFEGRDYDRIIMDEGSYSSEEGFPQIRVFSVPIAIPIDGHASAVIQSSNQSRIGGINLGPVPTMDLVDGEQIYHHKRDFAAYSRKDLHPASIMDLSEPAFVGDRRFVTLRIYPFQYAAGNQEIVVHDALEIAVSLAGSKSSNPDWMLSSNVIDQAADAFFINNASSKSWRKQRQRSSDYQPPEKSLNLISEIQIIVDAEGIYQVGYQDLKDLITEMTDSLGMDMSWDIDTVDPRRLELRDEYGQIPIHFVGENDGSFDRHDYFEFFGDRHYGDTGYYDDFTSENVYTLRLVDGYGARMVVENGGLINSNPLQYYLADAYQETVHFEQQLVSDKLGRGWTNFDPKFYKEDVWFWRRITAPNLEIVPIELEYPIDSRIRTTEAKIALHGLSYFDGIQQGQFDHEATIRLNEAMVNSHTWVGQTEKIFENRAPIINTFLRHGTNQVYISLPGNTVSGDREQVLLDYIQLTYWRQYRTSRDYMKFSKPSDRPNGLYQFELEGFSSPNVSVYKIGSSVFSNLQIEPFSVDGGAPWTVSMQDSVSSQAVRYYAVEESSKKRPKAFRLNIPSDLRNPMHAANVVVISPYEFMEAEGTMQLVDLWQSEEHSVKIVDVQDIYDEFNHGIVSAESIKDFLRYAYNNWGTPSLSHVILLGEGVADTRDNSSSRIYNKIPVRKTWTNKHGATASDNWYACIVGDDTIPDIVIARLNVWREDQILDYAAKAIQYRENLLTNRLWNSHLTFTAGGKIDDSHDIFSQQSERIRRKVVPKSYRVSRVYTSTQTVSSDYFGGTFNLKDAINSGTQFVQFMGHGGGRVWADYNLFNFNDVATLNNQAYPVFLSLACYASAFDTNGANSISEALVNTPNKGAIAALGFTGLGYLLQDEDWGLAFGEAAFQHDFPTLGEAHVFTLARFFTTTDSPAARYALTDGAAYIGDPLIRFNRPIDNQEVAAVNPNPSEGEVLQVQASFPQDVSAARLYIMNKNEKVVNVPYDLPVINGEFSAEYSIPANQGSYTNKILVAGYSPQKEYVGRAAYAVGRPAISHLDFVPQQPSYLDSTLFKAEIFSPNPIVDIYCTVRTDSLLSQGQWIINWVDLPMELSEEENVWITTQSLGRYGTAKELFFKYIMVDSEDNRYESALEFLQIAGPDLVLTDIVLDPGNTTLQLDIKSTNVGNAASIMTDLRLYYRHKGELGYTQFSTQDFEPLEVNEERWDSIDISGIPPGYYTLQARVNVMAAFAEWDFFVNTNNYISLDLPMNYHSIDAAGGTVSSIDGNLECIFPPGFVASGNLGVSVNSLAQILPNNQPDVLPTALQNPDPGSENQISVPYEIRILDSSLVDSLGFFEGARRIELSFSYLPPAPDAKEQKAQPNYKIYRYNSEYDKWVLHGGHISVADNTVSFEVNREGIFSVFNNADNRLPSVDVNVEDQEFTVGGYVAGNGIISLLLSDANGIDVIDDSIKLFLNGVEVPQADYVISINRENINRVPIKYQLALGRGNHELKVDCRDLNGNFMTREIQFIVNDRFDIVNIANYPNPVVGHAQDPRNDGRTRFTYILTDTADEVTIKVYTISGRLVRTFRNLPTGVGYHEYPRTVYAWDCTDEQGYTLANGTYFYKVVARKGGKKIEKTMKMAILR